jgi:hypothetical protein
VAKPTGTQTGDLLVLTYTTDWDTLTQMGNPGAGWTEVPALQVDSGTNSLHSRTWWKFATATEPASYTVAGTAAQSKAAVLVAYRGADTTTPIDTAAGATPTRDNTIECPSLTTTAPDVLTCVYAGGYNPSPNPGQSFAPPTGMTERADTTDTYLLTGAATQTLTTTGPTGQRVATATAPFTGGTATVATAYAVRGA